VPTKLNREAAIDATIAAAVARGAVVAMSLSGGKDSTAAAFEANAALDAAGHPRSRRIAVHADLGRAEWRQTSATVEAIAASLGLPLHIVRHGQHDMVSRWQDRFERGLARYAALETLCLIGPWSSPSLRFCTSEFKAAVITRFLRASYPGDEIISVIGIRRDESHGRRLAPISAIDTRLADARGTRGLVWHPLVEWQTGDVFDLHAHACLPLHDAYTVFGSTRLSCGFCIMSSLRDMLASASCDGNHDLYGLLVDLELRSAFSFQAGRWLADVAPALLSTRQLAAVADAKDRARERRQLEASLPLGLRYVKGWPPREPSLDEAATIAATRTIVARHNRIASPYLTASAVRERFAELIASARS
jgi:3'-phosphoadenosine 5'-phosphosulfate sulfotransferase (PAPS reductase)/FAD synthetase